MRRAILVLIVILITLPVYAIDRNLRMKGIDALKNTGICANVRKTSIYSDLMGYKKELMKIIGEKIPSEEGPYCIVKDKISKDLGKCLSTGQKCTECEWTVEGYAEGNFLKPGEIISIIIVRDSCAAHVGSFGRTVFIAGLKAIIFPYKRWD